MYVQSDLYGHNKQEDNLLVLYDKGQLENSFKSCLKKKWLYNVQKMKDVIRSPKQFGHIFCSYLVDKTYVGTTLITYKTEHFCLESDLVYLEKYIKKKTRLPN